MEQHPLDQQALADFADRIHPGEDDRKRERQQLDESDIDKKDRVTTVRAKRPNLALRAGRLCHDGVNRSPHLNTIDLDLSIPQDRLNHAHVEI
ncbi:hypothetical protein D3C72_1056750 [compost metagenome]